MSFARFINLAQSFKSFVNNTSKLPNKGNWKKLRLGKDTAFEFLCKLIIEKHPIFKKLEIEKIWHESEIPYREKKIINYPENLGDVGFDLLIKTKNNNYHAVQCKFRSDPKITLKIEKGSELATTFNLANVNENGNKIIITSDIIFSSDCIDTSNLLILFNYDWSVTISNITIVTIDNNLLNLLNNYLLTQNSDELNVDVKEYLQSGVTYLFKLILTCTDSSYSCNAETTHITTYSYSNIVCQIAGKLKI